MPPISKAHCVIPGYHALMLQRHERVSLILRFAFVAWITF